MSYNSSFTGQQADAALQRAAVIQMDGDGTKFLSDNGTYKEAGDKTNVLILSLENDLANGQKDSPITAEVSASLVDAITTGKACVIKSANSDILVNLQQIGSNVTIIMEQISRVGQTFVAVNTSITVNTSTNVIADYQTGAIVLETEGDGSKFLADDGTYKGINGAYSFDYNNITNDTYTGLQNAIANNQAIVMNNNGGRYQILKASDNTSNIQLLWINAYTASDSDNRCKAILYRLTLNSDLSKNLKLSYVKRAYAAKNLDSYLTPATFVSSYENYQPDTVILYINDANNAAVVFSGLADIDRSKDITINQVQQVNGDLYNFYLTIPVTGNMAYGATAIASSNQYLDMSIFTGESGTLSEEDYQKVVDAFNNKVSVGAVQEAFMPISISDLSDKYEIYVNATGPGESYLGVGVYIYSINKSDKTFTFTGNGVRIENSGDGTKFLSDDGTYKTVSSQPMKVLTESEYSALGTTPETDNVLYFVTPD